MDADVATAASTLVTTLKTDALGQIETYLPIAGAVLITVAVLFFGIRMFRAVAHV